MKWLRLFRLRLPTVTIPRRLRYTVETLLVNALVLSTLYQLLVYLANRRFWRQIPLPPGESDPTISAIVPLHHRTLDTLALLHLLAVTGPTDRYRVLLVLEDEHAPVYGVAAEIARTYPDTVRIVLSGAPGDQVPVMHRLNAGYKAADSELIAFVTPDVQMTAELWSAALASMDDPTVGAAFAPPLMLEPERRTESPVPTGGEVLTAVHINHAHTAGLPFAALSNRVTAMANGFILVRRGAMEQAGGMLHLLDEADAGASLGRLMVENGQRIAVIPVPVLRVPRPETGHEATEHIRRILFANRVYNLRDFIAWPFTNPLTVGFILGWITERQGRWWGRRTWWGFAAFRLALAYGLDRMRFGRAFGWSAYAQLFMLDTFVSPVLWAQALVRRTLRRGGRVYRVAQGGRATRLETTSES